MKKTKIQLADERIRKKINQIETLLEQRDIGKIDWHSLTHYLLDASSVAVATNDYVKRNP